MFKTITANIRIFTQNSTIPHAKAIKKRQKSFVFPKIAVTLQSLTRTRGVAQLVSAPRSGRGGRKFESSHPDWKMRISIIADPHFSFYQPFTANHTTLKRQGVIIRKAAVQVAQNTPPNPLSINPQPSTTVKKKKINVLLQLFIFFQIVTNSIYQTPEPKKFHNSGISRRTAISSVSELIFWFRKLSGKSNSEPKENRPRQQHCCVLFPCQPLTIYHF